MRESILFIEDDAFSIMPKYLGDPKSAWFVDPPYTAGGKRAGSRLYTHTEIDHEQLFSIVANADGPAMLTYDEGPEVRELAGRHGFKTDSVAMKNTHHSLMNELIITKPAHASDADRRGALANVFRKPPLGIRSAWQIPLFG